MDGTWAEVSGWRALGVLDLLPVYGCGDQAWVLCWAKPCPEEAADRVLEATCLLVGGAVSVCS